MDYILTTHDLTKQYGTTLASNKVNLHIPRGKVYGLIGRNGAGKTTVLRMICGLSVPTSGSFTFNGKTGKELSTEMRKIGCLIESPGLYLNMTAYDNLRIKCLAVGKTDRQCIDELLELVGLTHASRKPVRNFSLGMKQRLGIAIALAGDPELVVLDEPINGLDPQGIAEMRKIIAGLAQNRGITVIVSSHILEELHKVADAFGIIHGGLLVDELTAAELDQRCSDATTIRSNDDQAVCAALQEMGIPTFHVEEAGSVRIEGKVEEPAQLLRTLVQKDIAVSEFVCQRSTLEEYYLSKTGGASNA